MKKIFLLKISILFSCFIYGQGCSDAGFCTMNGLKPESYDSSGYKSSFYLGISSGKADNNISVLSSFLGFTKRFGKRLEADAKITTLKQSGNDITENGFSDLYLNLNYSFENNLKLIIGTKLPFSTSDNNLAQIPLPMDYQSSLGTIDLILGGNYTVNNFQTSIGFQIPLTQNKNEFLSERFATGSALRNFQSTNKFVRSSDALIRLSYLLKLTEKVILTPAILSIYHLSNDKFIDASGLVSEIKGSSGLTLNGNVFVDYFFNLKNNLRFSIAAPFVVRENRPDGLTRSFLATLEYKYNF